MIGGALYVRVTLQGLTRPCISLTSHLATFCTFADDLSISFSSCLPGVCLHVGCISESCETCLKVGKCKWKALESGKALYGLAILSVLPDLCADWLSEKWWKASERHWKAGKYFKDLPSFPCFMTCAVLHACWPAEKGWKASKSGKGFHRFADVQRQRGTAHALT